MRPNSKQDWRAAMSNLEELKKDMDQKRKTAYGAYAAAAAAAAVTAADAAAYADAAYAVARRRYEAAADADAAYAVARRRYEAALEQAPATSSDERIKELERDKSELLAALKYHQEQTRPIEGTTNLLAALEKNDE